MSSEYQAIQQTLHGPPSAITQRYFQLGQFLRHPAGVLVVILGLLGVWRFFTGNSLWRFRLPIYGSWLSSSQAVIFLRWCDDLLRMGLPLPEAVRLASSACSPPLDSVFQKVADKVAQGTLLSQALGEAPTFPSMAVWLIEQEEHRESMDLRSVARFLSRELDTTEARGTASIEPVALLAIGATLLFVCIATQGALTGMIEGLG